MCQERIFIYLTFVAVGAVKTLVGKMTGKQSRYLNIRRPIPKFETSEGLWYCYFSYLDDKPVIFPSKILTAATNDSTLSIF